MEMRACYNILNEQDYLKYSVESLIHAVDEVVIVEGATPFAPLHRNGLSVDNTEDIIRALQRKYPGKIRHIKKGLVRDRLELQNAFLDAVPDKSHVLFSGGDEIWNHVELQLFRDTYREDHLVEVYVWQMEFRHDFWHRLPIVFNEKSKGVFLDRNGMKYHNGFIQERIYFKDSGTGYHDYHTHVQDHKGRALYADGHYEKYRMRGDIHFHHFGRLCSLDKIRLKLAHLFCQNKWKKKWTELTSDEKKLTLQWCESEWTETQRHDERYAKLVPAEPPEQISSHPYLGLKFHEIPRQEVYKLEI